MVRYSQQYGEIGFEQSKEIVLFVRRHDIPSGGMGPDLRLSDDTVEL